ncbi:MULTISPECIES: hypothetical protein [unclassified Mucilaginibacter]|uniref:hypothetical protein n=1 Tax=unclassified Mucilaginibacter TaxID=2617802 RepID=UPI002AC9D94B|nr:MULTISPECIES: hypothetical protein [unclassified Mucilaginibacter]MEB0263935.1 DUF6252 family protein [Mucilaginibacter sp. 10I4]MEB0280152.1 DUF6252 family protein [Mucilaginibacter sp. 10B2]MEB0301644.1 DUF6252 family protein [Mucilaginibacter sp. 5C4]WPX24439.1 hypothetical protein RHM67_04015 [Mucilaginibacter sp. 5C4]
MKKLTFTYMALLTLLLSACLKKDDNCCRTGYQQYFVTERNGLSVYAEPFSKKIGTDSISVLGLSRDAGIKMHIKYTGKGTYTLTGNQAKYYQIVGNDTVSRYNAGIAAGSTLEVTDVDSTVKAITGKFTLKFKRTFPATSSIYPDSVKFTKGNFLIYLPR